MPKIAIIIFILFNFGPPFYAGFVGGGILAPVGWSIGMAIFAIATGWRASGRGTVSSALIGLCFAIVANVPIYLIGRWISNPASPFATITITEFVIGLLILAIVAVFWSANRNRLQLKEEARTITALENMWRRDGEKLLRSYGLCETALDHLSFKDAVVHIEVLKLWRELEGKQPIEEGGRADKGFAKGALTVFCRKITAQNVLVAIEWVRHDIPQKFETALFITIAYAAAQFWNRALRTENLREILFDDTNADIVVAEALYFSWFIFEKIIERDLWTAVAANKDSEGSTKLSQIPNEWANFEAIYDARKLMIAKIKAATGWDTVKIVEARMKEYDIRDGGISVAFINRIRFSIGKQTVEDEDRDGSFLSEWENESLSKAVTKWINTEFDAFKTFAHAFLEKRRQLSS
jgi:hypothetical protein